MISPIAKNWVVRPPKAKLGPSQGFIAHNVKVQTLYKVNVKTKMHPKYNPGISFSHP